MLSIIPSDPLPYVHASTSGEPDNSSRQRRRTDDDDDDDDMDGSSNGSENEAGPSKLITSPGEIITSSREFMRGHGTYIDYEGQFGDIEDDVDDGKAGAGGGGGVAAAAGNVISTVAGTIDRVNKLVSVRPAHFRYAPDAGDLVIGRVSEVIQARWKVDINARQDARLDLTSVNLPGGVQRRRVEQDALKMREFLAEGDLLVAEVREVYQDGAANLHTRSLRYGKLRNGFLISIPPYLIRRLKSHFYSLPPPCGPQGVDVILGLNGFLWVAVSLSEDRQVGGQGFDEEGVYSDKNDVISPESRRAISLVARLVLVLAKHSIPLSDTLLMEAYNWCQERLGEGEDAMSDENEREMLLAIVGVDVME